MKTLDSLKQTIGGTLVLGPQSPPDAATLRLGPAVIDSRQIAAGDVFWGLPGRHCDGSEYAAEAFDRGAVGAVVSTTIEPPTDRWTLCVEDTAQALAQWARWNRQQFTGTVIGVTGSVGKTTTRQMIQTVLRHRLTGSASPRNFNNHLGVPLSLVAIESRQDYAVVELGASARGEIAELAELARPTIGVITAIGDAHLGGFGSTRAVAEAKAEIVAAIPSDGHAVLIDDPWLRRLMAGAHVPITWIGCGEDCDLAATGVEWHQGLLSFHVEDCPFRIPVWGRHHIASALAAVAVARQMGFDLAEAARTLENFEPVPMRCEVIELRGATIINDAYNASPQAMQAALELLRDFDAAGRRIVVCGDMAELGDESVRFHRRLGDQVVTIGGADLLIACGQYAREVVAGARAAGMPQTRAIPCRTPEESFPYVGQAIVPGDVVLVKGSRALAMERVVEALTHYPKRRSA